MTDLLRHLRNSALAVPVALAGSAAFAEGDMHDFEAAAAATLEQCAVVAENCAGDVQTAAGVLVFPEVIQADLIVGGGGGDGVLFVDGEVQGYYDIGKASVGLQAGIDQKSMVFVFRDDEDLAGLTDNEEWEVGAAAGVTVADANASATAETGPVVYIFDAEGLGAEININALRIWEDDEHPNQDPS